MEQEKDALDAYKEAGVELPPEAEPQPEEAPEEPKEPEQEPEETPEAEPDEPLQPEPQPAPKKRSIYKDYKSEKELRKQVEQERDDLRQKLEALESANTPAEKEHAKDDLDDFAKEIGADPSAIKRMRELFLKDLPKSEMSDELSNQLKEFQEWKQEHSEAVELANFEREYKAATPSLNKMFPNASAEEAEAIKEKLQELVHTDAFHDKELDYIAFKNQETLSALVSPKKRGLEPKKRTDAPEGDSFTFDPNADLTKLSPQQAEAWEKEYAKLTSSDQLHTDAEGRKIII